MADYSRDQDIGKTTKETVNTEVQNLTPVIEAVEDVSVQQEFSIAELKKIRLAKEIEFGDDLPEVD